jgi:hypothetical protein
MSQTIMILRRGALEFIEAEEALSKALLTILQLRNTTYHLTLRCLIPSHLGHFL